MLSFDEALSLLHTYGKDEPWIRHCRAVSRVAERAASLISKKQAIPRLGIPRLTPGVESARSREQKRDLAVPGGRDVFWSRPVGTLEEAPLDARLLTVGALLHDIGRCRTQDPIRHGVEGYRLLTGLGHHEEAFICASHVLCGMPKHEAVQHGLPERDFVPTRLEERLIPLIDSMVELDRPTTLEERCSSICRRYQANPAFLRRFETAADIARSFHRSVQSDFGFSLEDVAREVLR